MKTYLFIFFVAICLLSTNCIAQNKSGFYNIEEDVKVRTLDSILSLFDEYRFSDPAKALNYAKKALYISTSNHYNSGIAESHYKLGLINNQLGNFDKALGYLESALELSKRTTNSLNIIKCYNQIGVTYKNKGNYSKSLEILTKIAQKAQNSSFQEELVLININIAQVFHLQSYYKEAIKLLESNLNKPLDNITKASINNTIGNAYKALKNTNKALFHYHKSYENCTDINNNPCELKSLGNIATIYLEQHQYDKALGYLLKIEKVEKKINNNKIDLIATYNSIGIAYRLKKDFKKGIEYIHKAEELAREIKSSSDLKKIYLGLAVAYEEAGQYVKAIDYLYFHKYLSDSLFTIKEGNQVSELLIKYETEKKEQKISLLKKDNELQTAFIEKQRIELARQKLEDSLEAHKKKSEILRLKNEADLKLLSLQKEKKLQSEILKNNQSELQRQSLVQNQMIFIFLFLVITSIILIYTYHQKLKSKELLASKTEEINKQKTLKLIHDQEVENIKSNIKWQEKEKERISSELHDGIAPSIAAVKLNLLKLSETSNNTPKFQKLIQIVDNTYEEIRAISHNFSSFRMSNTPFIDLLENYLKEIDNINSLNVVFRCNSKEKINQIPDDIKVEIYRIIQESMNNVIKHAKAKSTEVQLTWNTDYLNLMVEDTGVGFDTNKKSLGMGLNNIKSRVSILQGVLDLDSLIDRGTIINIDIPVFPK